MTYDLANSFIVVLPHTIIQIPATSNLSWLTLFYTLPHELVAKRPEFLELPRNVYQVLSSEISMPEGTGTTRDETHGIIEAAGKMPSLMGEKLGTEIV